MQYRRALDKRTLELALGLRSAIRMLPRNIYTIDDMRQLLRSSGSIGANYLEANQALGKRDQLMRMRIARKEARETEYWLTLVMPTLPFAERPQWYAYKQEALEIAKILSAIIKKLDS